MDSTRPARLIPVLLTVAALAAGAGSPGCPGRKAQQEAQEVTSFDGAQEEVSPDKQPSPPPEEKAETQAGEPESVPVPQDGAPWRVTIGATGDAMPHGRVKATALNQAQNPDEEGDDRYEGWWFIVKNLAPALQPTDVAMFNLESPIATERHEAKTAPPVQNGPPAMAEAFQAAGFDVVNLANNHMFDQMREGVVETVETVEAAGLKPFGAGESQDAAKKPLFVEAGGAKIAFLGWTFALNRNLLDKKKGKPWVMKWSDEWAKKAVAAAREEADLVVVSMHWGSEFGLTVLGHQKKAARLLCGAGADLVVGSGPHVLQPVMKVEDPASGRSCLVAYSLGNVLSNQGLKYRFGWKPPDLVQAKNVPYTRDSLLLRVTFAGADGQAVVEAIEGVPLWTENNWILRYQLKEIPPDRIWIQPILPLLKGLEEGKHRKLLEQRLPIIKEFVGDLIDYVEI
ncbi:MAG: CapA family protein [Deltaproteobacteria bacterium]|nr:CapA family protein [Deltaproteobacteria bacterium]